MRRAAFTLLVLALAACGASKERTRRADAEGKALRLDLARTFVERGAYEAAVPLLRRSAAEDPRNPMVHHLYGVVLRETGLYPQAEREFATALKLAPGFAAAWAGVGILYDLERRPAEAEKAHRHALAIDPQNAAYWNNLGFSLYVAGRNGEAITALERALSIDPTLAIAHNNLGFALGKKGDYPAAERAFRAAGGEVPAFLNLALVYERNGDSESAARLRAQARAIQPDVEETP